MEDNGSGSEVDELMARVDKLDPDERARLRALLDEPASVPLAGWASDPLKTKAALRHLTAVGDCTRQELADHLNTIEELGGVSSMDFGIVGRKSNDLFNVEKKGSKAEDVLSLTRAGEEVAAMFDDDMSGLTPAEKALYRGLHMYGHTVAFLGQLERHRNNENAHEDGILKEDLVGDLEQIYGGKASPYVGYSGTLCERLDLIKRTRDGNKMRYKLTVPEEWRTTG